MWNFLVGGLAHRCTLVLYDGSPLKDPSILWNLTDQLGITIFGTSAKYLDQLSVSTLSHPISHSRPLPSATVTIPLANLDWRHPPSESQTRGTDPLFVFFPIRTQQKGYKPREHHSLRTLRHIYSTGSPLAPPLFDYVYRDIHPNVLLGSITGKLYLATFITSPSSSTTNFFLIPSITLSLNTK